MSRRWREVNEKRSLQSVSAKLSKQKAKDAETGAVGDFKSCHRWWLGKQKFFHRTLAAMQRKVACLSFGQQQGASVPGYVASRAGVPAFRPAMILKDCSEVSYRVGIAF